GQLPRGAALPATLELAAGLREQPPPDGYDEPCLLGQRHEVVRGNEPQLRMRPADQRLEPLDAPGRDVHYGKVVDQELLAGQRAAQVGLQLDELRRPLAQRGIECRRARTTLRLGAVPRRVGG